MGRKKHPFDLVLSAKATSGTNDLEQEPIEDGRLYCIQRVAVENETSAYTELRIFKVGKGKDFLVAEEDTPQAATLYWIDEPFYLEGGQYLRCRLAGCTANDELHAYITGWWVDSYHLGGIDDA